MPNRLLDAGQEGIEGGMTNRKYMSLTSVSRATPTRELGDLVEKGGSESVQGRRAGNRVKLPTDRVGIDIKNTEISRPWPPDRGTPDSACLTHQQPLFGFNLTLVSRSEHKCPHLMEPMSSSN